MEVILKKDVENLGFTDDIVTVKNGYGRNYLIPRGMAVMATDSARKMHEETLRQRAFKEQKMVEDANTMATALADVELKVKGKVAEGGNKLFGSVSSVNLAEVLGGMGYEIDKKYIQITGGSAKALGKYHASIRLHREVKVDMEFEVIAE
jgi:large subunit ribosomal protein L9